MKTPRILIIEDDDSLRRVIEYNLTEEGYDVTTAADGTTGLSLFTKKEFDLCITDLQMPGVKGMDVLSGIKELSPDFPVIIMTAFGTIEKAVEGIKAGAFDFITKPFGRDQLTLSVRKALEFYRLKHENRYLRETLNSRLLFSNLSGSSAKMREVFDAVKKVAGTDSTVFLLGESGTGKELLAKAIHNSSNRKGSPFIVLDCTVIPRELTESELFGHIKGTFTGAISDRKGRIESAERGTIFLDEIGDMDLELQSKLLRFLQEKEYTPVGSNIPRKADVRVIAATNIDVEQAVKENRFREDLYYRLNVIPINIPPLRERKEDIPELIEFFLEKNPERTIIEKDVIDVLTSYSWPGNVRELENTIARLCIMRKGDRITLSDIPLNIRDSTLVADRGLVNMPAEGIMLDSIQKEAVSKALEMNNWNISKAARFLNVPRHILIYRMEKFGIHK